MMHKVSLVIIWLFCLFTVTLAFAAHPEIPRISPDELKKLQDTKSDIIILDVRIKDLYNMRHIKGALPLPWKTELTDADVKNLPKDKMIITYCDCGPGEGDSADVASQLMNLGFSNVKILSDPAMKGWIKSGYPVE